MTLEVAHARKTVIVTGAFTHIFRTAVTPCIVDTPMHTNGSRHFLKTLQPTEQISSVKDIVDVIVYLTEARQVTGKVLHVNGGGHVGKW
jgi:NAD(P)-dependent dehydrogenase (short-subunit alcohol dehydrogenase family)